MKIKIVCVSLLSMAGICLSASNNWADYLLVKKDSLVVNSNKIDSLPVAIAKNASTLMDADGNVLDTSVVKLPNTYAWTVDTRFGDRTLAAMDTIRENFHRSVLAEGEGIAVSYLGNIGGPLQQKEFFARKDASQFPFMDAYEAWRRTPEKHLFINTKVPYSNVQYQAGGGKQVAENRFKAELSSNFGKRLNAGFNFDYIYARGYYKSQFNKQTSYDFNVSYIGDRYKMHAFAGNNNLIVSDNGGITNDRYITQPDAEGLTAIRGNSLDIPVIFQDGLKNKLRGRHIFVTNSYDIGRDQELVQVNDTTSVWRKKQNYIAPASIILTTHYQDQRRQLTSSDRLDGLARFDSIYVPNLGLVNEMNEPILDSKGNPAPLYDKAVNDYMSHYTFTNTLAFRMNEGFRSWTKFGLTAFIEHEMRRFLLPNPTQLYISDRESDDVWFFGGALSKNQGKHLRYNASILKGINTNDLELVGDVATSFSLFGKEFGLRANMYFKNQVPNFFQENFSSRNWSFRNLGFNDTKRIYGGGEITFPKFAFSETSASGGYENITDYIYYGADRKPTQSSKSINILSLKLKQKLHMGIFHIEGQALLQKTTEDAVIPLPLWTLYGNAYLQTMVSKVLMVQLGVDGYMHQKYYAPGYDPLQIQFYNQREVKIGNFPHANVYINLHLKYTRFFIMMYNVAENFGNRQSFATPHHPVNPMMLRWGMSWKFNN